jgi:hypothetical protein
VGYEKKCAALYADLKRYKNRLKIKKYKVKIQVSTYNQAFFA